ncbi:NAD-dependent epimerase/dehydratase family protein [Streptomyces heilongjiangensis]|uniref:NAD-dependent epimerase/dehydratase family protein n=1 Tax=Streptomyces heilongjiangensis TaxID=945052 RepID=A0ABW1BJL4_9ACTN|nr:NAD-dependent epimerase/dehydratase family protein [Streptomyces heilongjiangensis]MDC2951813.1 NAD-dependent epimerase/dehydratase family protein [Streptomyces heilongjiangensis]
MRIIGEGFLARNLTDTFGDRFPDWTAIASGVSSTSTTTAAEYGREARLVQDVLAECLRDGQRLLFFSTASFAMYGFSERAAAETDPVRPVNEYGRHKLALEGAVRSSGAAHLVLRLSHVVGRHQRAHQLLPTLVRNVLAGEVTVHEGAHRDLLDVADLMHAVWRLLTDGVTGEVVNVASGVPQPVEAVVAAIERRLRVTARHVRHPGSAAVTRASVDRLRTLVPDFRAGIADADYLDALLDAYLPYYAAQSGALVPLPGR